MSLAVAQEQKHPWEEGKELKLPLEVHETCRSHNLPVEGHQTQLALEDTAQQLDEGE